MKNQIGEEERIKLSDFVIYNDGNKGLIPQVEGIMETISNKENILKTNY
jgi:dephospho-CoA kinase